MRNLSIFYTRPRLNKMENENVIIDDSDQDVSNSVTHRLAACYCGGTGDSNVVKCTRCSTDFHINCLKIGRPSNIKGDVFFDFTCERCSEDGREKCVGRQMNWLQVVYLALYNLICNGSGRKGYFRWKDDLCQFIEANWNTLNSDRKKTSSWRSTVAGILSSNCSKYFKNGQKLFKEGGWWTLQEVLPPAEKLDTSVTMMPARRRKKSDNPQILAKKTRTSERKRKMDEVVDVGKLENVVEQEMAENEKASIGDIDGLDRFFENSADLSDLDIGDVDPMENIFDDFEEDSNGSLASSFADVDMAEKFGLKSEYIENKTVEQEGVIVLDPEEEGATQSQAKPEVESCKPSKQTEEVETPELRPMHLDEEQELMERLSSFHSLYPSVKRLQRKIQLRQVKRSRGLPLFDMDSSVRKTLRTVSHYVIKNNQVIPVMVNPEEPDKPETFKPQERKPFGDRVLDRFLILPQPVSYKPVSFLNRLVGTDFSVTSRAITSPYTSRALKPYIRQDFETEPLKLKLLREMCQRYQESGPDVDWSPPTFSSIDYCYVQPHHIPGVNALCRDFFWPGIDLSECLQYPDFSCVVLYKRLVIGCAFMVPDVKCNEAYISFIVVHPDWRRAGIGSFMIYHLIQTCLGKDVTLHVSVNNPAMVIYQRFGFKPERFVVNFYERYMSNAKPEHKHAFFLRLRR